MYSLLSMSTTLLRVLSRRLERRRRAPDRHLGRRADRHIQGVRHVGQTEANKFFGIIANISTVSLYFVTHTTMLCSASSISSACLQEFCGNHRLNTPYFSMPIFDLPSATFGGAARAQSRRRGTSRPRSPRWRAPPTSSWACRASAAPTCGSRTRSPFAASWTAWPRCPYVLVLGDVG